MTTPFHAFDYLRFARFEMRSAEHELCMSGVPEAVLTAPGDPPPETRQARAGEVRARWAELVAARWGLPADHLLPSLGASGGVFLAVSALVTLLRERCDGAAVVAVERPAYGVFECAARLAGAQVTAFARTRDEHYALDPGRVAAALRAGARIVCLTNLHNPSGARLAPDALDALRQLAHEHDAWIVLDEVYRDYLPGAVGSDYAPGERIVCTSSMTKCYGVGGGRLGWIAAPPHVIERADRIVEITHGVDPMPVADVALRALAQADALLARGREVARRGRRVMDAWMAATPGVDWVPPAGGITALMHVAGLRDSFAVTRRLRTDLDVQVVAGAHFGSDDALRVSFGLPPARLQRALETLALGLAAIVR